MPSSSPSGPDTRRLCSLGLSYRPSGHSTILFFARNRAGSFVPGTLFFRSHLRAVGSFPGCASLRSSPHRPLNPLLITAILRFYGQRLFLYAQRLFQPLFSSSRLVAFLAPYLATVNVAYHYTSAAPPLPLFGAPLDHHLRRPRFVGRGFADSRINPLNPHDPPHFPPRAWWRREPHIPVTGPLPLPAG